jgi:hypothetical protein
MPLTAHTVLKGAAAYLDECQKISVGAVDDDQTEEIESMVNSLQIDTVVEKNSRANPQPGTSSGPSGPASAPKSEQTAEMTMGDEDILAQNLKTASAGVILESTLSNYRR